jgi:hypothetical protein
MPRPLPPDIEPFPGAQEQQCSHGHAPRCAWKGCDAAGAFRAPKDRALREHYLFCLGHVRAYNAQWDFHHGMTASQMEAELRSSATWGRPTWKLGSLGASPRPNKKAGWSAQFRAHDPLDLGADTAFDARARRRARAEHRRNPDEAAEETRALKVLELSPPITLEALQRKYKALAKKHHPDANGGAAEAETQMKLINAAYRTLKALLGITA